MEDLEQLGECEWLRISNLAIEKNIAEGRDINEVNVYLPCLKCDGYNYRCEHYTYQNIIVGKYGHD